MKLQYRHLVAIIFTIILFLDRLDLTIVNIALPTIANYFGIEIIKTEWVSMAFLLSLAISIPISSWVGERFGYKKSYVISIVLFGLGSTLCALLDSINLIIISRFIQGIGGGMLIPIGTTMLYKIYHKSEFANITSFTFIPSLIAPAIAPFIGGVVLDNFGWRYIFLFSGPICLILAIAVLLIIKEDESKPDKKLDFFGFVLSSLLLIDIFYTMYLVSKEGVTNIVLSGIIVGILLIISFIFWEKKHQDPLIDLNFFNNRIFIQANLIQLCFQICHFGAIFIVGMYLQVGVGMSASITGMIMSMQAVGAIFTSRYSVALFNKYGAKLPIIIGLLGVAIITPLILLIDSIHMVSFGIILFLTRGLFSGLCGTPIQTLSVINIAQEKLSQGNSIFNACRQISITSGIACSSILLSIGLKINDLKNISDIKTDQLFKVFALGFYAIPVVAFIGILIALTLDKNLNLVE